MLHWKRMWRRPTTQSRALRVMCLSLYLVLLLAAGDPTQVAEDPLPDLSVVQAAPIQLERRDGDGCRQAQLCYHRHARVFPWAHVPLPSREARPLRNLLCRELLHTPCVPIQAITVYVTGRVDDGAVRSHGERA